MSSLISSDVLQDERSSVEKLFGEHPERPNMGIQTGVSAHGRVFETITHPKSVPNCLCAGEVSEVCRRIEQVLMFGRSTDFSEGGLSEAGLKMVLFGLLASQSDTHTWEVLSEEKIGSAGHADVVLKQTSGQEAVVIEMKYVRAGHLNRHRDGNATSLPLRKGLEKTLDDLDVMSIEQLKSQKSKTWTKGDRTIQNQIKDAVVQCQRYARGWNQNDTVRSVVIMGVGRRVLGFTWMGNAELPESAGDWEETVARQNGALWMGLEGNDKELVIHSLEAGATLDSQQGGFFSPLHFTTTHGYEEMTTLLVERGGNIWLKDQSEVHPLAIALARQNVSLSHLFSCSADRKTHDPQVHMWPLEWAKMKEEEDSLRTEFVTASKILRTGGALLQSLFSQQLPKTAHQVPTIFASEDPLTIGMPSIVDKGTFNRHWNFLTDGLFGPDFPWSHVICAGGAVLACCLPLCAQDMQDPQTYFKEKSPFRGGDIDLFICGLSPDQATQKAKEIMEYFQRTGGNNPLFIRTKNCITIITGEGKKQVQIVLRCYQNPVEVLMGFDIDCCSVAFDGSDVVAIPRAIRALKYRVNIVDSSRQSTTYRLRMVKYAKRGFAVGVPGLNRGKINPGIFSQPLKTLNGIARLLALESGREEEDEPVDSDYLAFVVIPKTGSPGSINAIMTEQMGKFPTGAHFIHSFAIEDILTAPLDCHIDGWLERTLKASWLVENPGSQLTGSFYPIKEDMWSGVYRE